MPRRRFVVSLIAGALAVAFVAAVPSLAAVDPAPASERPARAPAEASVGAAPAVDADLALRLSTAGPDDSIVVFVHAPSIDAARAVAADAGLKVLDDFDQVAVALAVGSPAAVRVAAADPRASYIEADRAVEFFLSTSHQATRGAEARTAFQQVGGPDCEDGTGPGKGRGKRPEPPSDKPGNGPGPGPGKGKGPPGGEAGCGPAYAADIDGTGVGVAIIDSGVDGTHPMFTRDGESKVLRNLKVACFSNPPGIRPPQQYEAALNACPEDTGPFWVDVSGMGNDSDTPSGGGHGTHVAGIVGGYDVTNGAGDHLHGAAPGASLYALSIGYTLAISGGAAGMNWVLDHHADPCGDGSCPAIRVINNSWGSNGRYRPGSVLAKLQDQLVAQGVVVVWAAGNSGGDGSSDNTSIEGESPTEGVIMVANYNDGGTGTRNGTLSSSSSRGLAGEVATYPDIAAPGTSITSACRIHLPVCTSNPADPDYGTVSGTSMAAPHVAGIVAQLLQVRPELAPAEVEDVLEDTAYEFGFGAQYEPDNSNDGYTSYEKGHGLVDAVAALERLLGAAGPDAIVECSADAPAIVDPDGDARGFILTTTPRPSEPTLDVTAVDLEWSAEAAELRVVIDVLDLSDTDPDASEGIAFDVNFQRDGEAWLVRADRTAGAEPEGFVTAGDAERVAGLTAVFDTDADRVTVRIPSSALAGTGVEPLASGQVLSDFEFTSWHNTGPFYAGVDVGSGAGRCVHVLGAGRSVPPGSYTESPEVSRQPDTEMAAGSTYETSGAMTTSTSEYQCSGPDDPVCVSYLIKITEPGRLTFSVTTDEVGTALQDYDLVLYNLAGTELAVAGNPQTIAESSSYTISSPDYYWLTLQPYTVAEGSPYTVSASLD